MMTKTREWGAGRAEPLAAHGTFAGLPSGEGLPPLLRPSAVELRLQGTMPMARGYLSRNEAHSPME